MYEIFFGMVVMAKFGKNKLDNLFPWPKGPAGGAECAKGPEELCLPNANSFPSLRFFPAQFPAPVLSAHSGHVIVYCLDFELGSCIAEAASRFGRSVYICDDMEETIELLTSATDSFYCLLVAETFPGGDQDFEQLFSQMHHKEFPHWAFINSAADYCTRAADKAGRDTTIVEFERLFVECCRSFDTFLW